jgi:hypothetical protein
MEDINNETICLANHICDDDCKYPFNCVKFLKKQVIYHNFEIPYSLRKKIIFDLSNSGLEDYLSVRFVYQKEDWFYFENYSKSICSYLNDKIKDEIIINSILNYINSILIDKEGILSFLKLLNNKWFCNYPKEKSFDVLQNYSQIELFHQNCSQSELFQKNYSQSELFCKNYLSEDKIINDLTILKTENQTSQIIFQIYEYFENYSCLIPILFNWLCTFDKETKLLITFHLFIYHLSKQKIFIKNLTQNQYLCKELLFGTFDSRKYPFF